jgi:hypothetical protein
MDGCSKDVWSRRESNPGPPARKELSLPLRQNYQSNIGLGYLNIKSHANLAQGEFMGLTKTMCYLTKMHHKLAAGRMHPLCPQYPLPTCCPPGGPSQVSLARVALCPVQQEA